MKIGLVQFAPRLADVEGTIADLSFMENRMQGADLLVFPELCNSGYNFESREQAIGASEPASGGPLITYMADLCRRQNCLAVTGLNERDGGRLYNSAVLIGPEGIRALYRKIHLFDREKLVFEPGDIPPFVMDIGVCRIGMLVCFDWFFPEVWRILALRGADVICHPANLVMPGLAQRGVPLHALLNRVFIVTANRTGRERDLAFTGTSFIAGPRGEVLAQAGPEDAAVVIIEIDPALARDKRVNERNDIFGDRRREMYQDLGML
ncbi:MAG TPA: nitrilase-related carbon-nitrogen hydrolase [Candidatus Sumerlaeota bacterium]|nr:nitrilase-related carbon-nitrogen hydrolase [Candidatus Sumerlaeota bacterium]